MSVVGAPGYGDSIPVGAVGAPVATESVSTCAPVTASGTDGGDTDPAAGGEVALGWDGPVNNHIVNPPIAATKTARITMRPRYTPRSNSSIGPG